MPLFIGLLILSLVILFNATKDRWRWKRILTWVGATTGVLLLLFVGLLWYWSQPKPTSNAKNVLWDLRLGTTEEEVLFLKG
jgi:4-amino-4-deoxy-L-arabinose transferase-like glycosyltransferase